MKLIVVLFGSLHIFPRIVNSLTPGDNSHYVEGKSRYIWMLGRSGVPQLVDLKESIDQNILKRVNGANNQYWLFTRRNPLNAQVIVYGDVNTIWNSNYLGFRPLAVIVHGWNNNGNTTMNPLITSAFLAVLDANVIVVDWSVLASANYNTAVVSVPSVGQFLGNFLIWLFSAAGGNWNKVHLVGYSLGAHVVGIAGRIAAGKPARITGLDPAGPQWNGNSDALSRNSGQYVESIHTDSGVLGTSDSISDADFYPNGGKNPQPGCLINTCSHGRATELFASTIRYNHLIGRRCSSASEAQTTACAGGPFQMGNSIITKRGTGIYALYTGSAWPF